MLSIVECRLSNRDRSSIISECHGHPHGPFTLFLLLVNFIESEFLPKSMDFGEDWNQIMQRVADNVEEQCKKDGGKFNETAISRAVVRSQPKQASDVPSWVTFVRRWGGGTNPRSATKLIKGSPIVSGARVNPTCFVLLWGFQWHCVVVVQ